MVQRPLTQRSPHTQAPTSQSCPDWPPHPSVLQSLQAPTDGRRKLGWVRQGAQSQVRTGTGQLPPHAPAEPRPPASALWAPGSTRGLLSSKANKALAQKDPEHTAPPHLAWPGPSKRATHPKASRSQCHRGRRDKQRDPAGLANNSRNAKRNAERGRPGQRAQPRITHSRETQPSPKGEAGPGPHLLWLFSYKVVRDGAPETHTRCVVASSSLDILHQRAQTRTATCLSGG